MKTNSPKVIIANKTYAAKIEKLRSDSYHNSSGFKIIDEDGFQKYSKWSEKDDNGIVLVALNEDDTPNSCLRGNLYFSQSELELNNLNFLNNSHDFITYPVLDMTIAATSPDYFKTGLLSVLRYYMYLLHRHSVKSITGVAVKNSSIYKTLEKFGYEFREIELGRKELSIVEPWTIARINTCQLDFAINYLKEKYAETIMNYPLIIS